MWSSSTTFLFRNCAHSGQSLLKFKNLNDYTKRPSSGCSIFFFSFHYLFFLLIFIFKKWKIGWGGSVEVKRGVFGNHLLFDNWRKAFTSVSSLSPAKCSYKPAKLTSTLISIKLNSIQSLKFDQLLLQPFPIQFVLMSSFSGAVGRLKLLIWRPRRWVRIGKSTPFFCDSFSLIWVNQVRLALIGPLIRSEKGLSVSCQVQGELRVVEATQVGVFCVGVTHNRFVCLTFESNPIHKLSLAADRLIRKWTLNEPFFFL